MDLKIRLKYFIASLVFLSILFPFFQLVYSAQSNPKIETGITTVEGVVYVYEIGRDDLKEIHTLTIAEFIRYKTVEIIEVRRGVNREMCYVPEEIRGYAEDKLKPNIPVLLRANNRPKYKTEWDLVAIGVDIKAGYEYSAGVVVVASPVKIQEIMNQVQELRANVSEAGVSEALVTPAISEVSMAYSTLAEKGVPVEEKSEEVTPVPVIPTEPTPPAVETAEYYWVDPVNGNNGNEGSENNPWRTITHALANIDTSVGTTINLKSGTYSPSSNSETFPLRVTTNSITIQKNDTGTVTIDAENTAGVFFVFGVSGVTINSVTIQGGRVTTEAAGGAGVHIESASGINITNCNVTNNTISIAGGFATGGGIRIADGSSNITISNCNVSGNSVTGAGAFGAGISIFNSSASSSSMSGINITGGTISNNTSSVGGGGIGVGNQSAGTTVTSNITGVTINNNIANGAPGAFSGGGGIGIQGNAGTIILNVERCTLSSNTASGGGGGIDIANSVTATITRCTLNNNNSTIDFGDGIGLAGALANPTATINNCLIYSNDTYGIVCDNNSSATVVNCTLYGHSNSGARLNSQATMSFTNCIFGNNNLYGILDNSAANPTINNSLFNNNGVANLRDDIGVVNYSTSGQLAGFGSGNIGSDVPNDPAFKNAGGGDFRIGAGSQCINAGTSSGAPSVDIRGQPRDGSPDIGCYEYIAALGDPPITGRVYDSVTGENISSPVVGIYRKGETTSLSTTTGNPFTFNVDPGSYFIAVNKSGYAFPSQIVASTVSGDHGDVFTASSTSLTIDIPMDPDGYLYIEKTVNKKRVVMGEIITYNVKIQNKHWFKSVDNVVLVDELVNGFKYVEDSSTSNQKPETSNQKIIFNLGTISANSTVNISYQVRVGSGIPPGRYKTTAVCRKETTNEQRSNEDSAEVEVVEDALFTRGTIIGKVFYDINGNGVQDKGEAGIPNIKIAAEYGVVVETDNDGKYHIADVPPGRHLLKIMPDSIPEFLQELGGVEYTTDNPYLVEITEGLLAKVNFGVTQIEPLTQTLSPEGRGKGEGEFFIVALGEGTLRNLETSGNIEMASSGRDDRYDDGLRVDGRLAFYLKGKVLGKYLITASMDTDRRPKGRNDTSRLFTNLDPDKYYPVYGDASQVDYSATDTQDIGYVLIEWDNSFAKWGNFHTNLPMYSRTLSGGKVEYRSVKKTKFGEPYTEVDVLYANARQKPAHNEFIGTGGSLYYLKHRDIIEGSEKVRVEVRDRVSRVPIESVPLQEERDYEIDYDTGRILLKRPLNISNWAYKSSIVSNDILSGERVYLVVDYEYYITGGLSKQAVGGRAKQHIGNHIDVEGMYIEEEKEDSPYKLYRGDSTLRINENTYITAGYTHTKETQLGTGTSIDGGLSFINLNEDYSNNKSGSAVDVKAETRLFNNTDVLFSYDRQDPYFSTTDSLSTSGTQKYIGSIITQIKSNMYAGIKHLTQRLLAGTIGSQTIGTTNTNITTGIFDWTPDPWDIRLEYQHQEVTRVLSGFTYMGFLPYHNNDFIATRVGYNFTEKLHGYIRGQGTVQGRADNQLTLGSDVKILKDTYINLAETVGTLGDSTLLGVTSQLREDTDVYANIETGNHMDLGKFTRTSYGQTVQLTKDSKVYASHDYSSYQERLIRGNLLGYDKKLTDNLLLGLTYERSNIEDTSTKSEANNFINRDSGSISLGYLDVDRLKVSTKLECRNDRGQTVEKRQWVTENDGQWYITPDITILGRANWGWTEDRATDNTEAEFTEVGAGFSLRPVKWDKLNLLAKYSYITDLPPDEQVDFIEETESRRHVVGLEGGYDICRYLGLVGKFAYRAMEEKVGLRDWTDSDTYLYIGRFNFHVTNKWDIAAEYRTLTNTDIDDTKSGWLFEVDREIVKYVRIGAGYNFTDYDDDLRNDDNWDAKGWFVRVIGKY